MTSKVFYPILTLFFFAISTTLFVYFDKVSSAFPASYRYVNLLIFDKAAKENISSNYSVTSVKSKKENTHFWTELPVSFDAKCLLSLNTNITWDTFPEENLDFLSTQEGKKYKKILAWHGAYVPHLYFGFGRRPFKEACCKEKRCFMTAKRDVLPVTDFDAIIFQHYGLQENDLPQNRSANQRWIFFEKEPPTISFANTRFYNGLFNWTMTYRTDSDIFDGYGYVFPKSIFALPKNETEAKINSVLELQVRNKTKMAAWFVSHCKTSSLRETFIDELKNYIQIDIYGKCGSFKCSSLNQTLCHKMLQDNYRFYLSFENSLCKDYVTEKFFSIMRLNVVPVVFGSADYDSIAPPHSYINARKFSTVRKLADYLLYLSNNNTAYLEYFRWKTEFVINSMAWITGGLGFCSLCKKLHEDHRKKTYFDIKNWYIRKSDCTDLYPK